MHRTHLILLLLLALLVGLCAAPVASACPGCKEAVAAADDENGTPVEGYSQTGAAFSYSVLFMLGMLATLLLGFGTAFYRMMHKSPRSPQRLS